MAQIMDKRFTSEMKKLQREMDTRLSDIRADFQTDISEMAAKVESVSEGVNSGGQVDGIARNVVIRELPEHEGENTLVKVNNLFRDQLKLMDVSATGAVRKESIGRKPGVVVVTFESLEDKQKVLKSKKLHKNSMMKKVYIHPDQTRSERLQHANLRALVDAINRGDGKITVRWDRIVKNDSNVRQSATREHLTESRESQSRYASGNRETTLIAFLHHVEKIQTTVVNVACLAIMTDVITEVEPRVQTDPNMPRTSRDIRSKRVVGMFMGGVLIVTLTIIVCVKHA